MTTRRIALACLLACMLMPWSVTSRAENSGKNSDLARVPALIEALQLDEAERLLAKVDAEIPSGPSVLWERSMLDFYRGDYAAAVKRSQQAIDATKDEHAHKAWTEMHELMRATEEGTHDFQHVKSADGRYIVEFPEGKDRVLVPYALDVLARMDHELANVMGHPVPGPIRLEVYASAESLSKVSTLTLEQIQTSGTVALCKWNRLMITSPRALVRGYPWVDTIAHELTHLYLTYTTQEKAPVWLQEGTAKLLERRWRDPRAPYVLEPTSRVLLERATRDGKLLTFEQLHPSIALLPSQDDATLAFAQVSTFMNDFVLNQGEGTLRAAFALVAGGKDAKEALAQAAHQSFAALEKSWRSKLPKAANDVPAPRKLARRFRAGHEETPDESADVTQAEARRFMRLGDLLWSAQHPRAAMLEYDKAHRADADDPIVAARLARAALAGGDPARSLAALEPLMARYPEHAPAHDVRGEALAALGRNDEARTNLIESIRINPFDPAPHCALARLPNAGDAATERNACTLLGGSLQSSR